MPDRQSPPHIVIAAFALSGVALVQRPVPDLIVAESARSRGAGKALLAEALERSRARGCWSLTLESASWRARAHAFYEREGMSNSAASFTRLLVDMDWPPKPR